MLSTLAFRKGLPNLSKALKLVAVVPKRNFEAIVSREDYKLLPNEELIPLSSPLEVTIEQQIQHWDEANEIFFGKDRDMKNFPHPEFAVEPPATNFGMVPTSWLMQVYERLGVSGAYTTVLGTVAFMGSKEYGFSDYLGVECVILSGVFCLFLTKVGPFLKNHIDKTIQEERDMMYEEPLREAKMFTSSNIEIARNSIWRMEAVGDIYAAKKEMVDLQLESLYRERLHKVHKEVKEKLDYQVDMIALQRKFQQTHMVSWIVDQVQKSITPQMEKDNIKSCIANLGMLAKQA